MKTLSELNLFLSKYLEFNPEDKNLPLYQVSQIDDSVWEVEGITVEAFTNGVVLKMRTKEYELS